MKLFAVVLIFMSLTGVAKERTAVRSTAKSKSTSIINIEETPLVTTAKLDNFGTGPAVNATQEELALCGGKENSPVDLSSQMPPITSQGETGWCYIHATSACLNHFIHAQNKTPNYYQSNTVSLLEIANSNPNCKSSNGSLDTNTGGDAAANFKHLFEVTTARSDSLVCSVPPIAKWQDEEINHAGNEIILQYQNTAKFKDAFKKCEEVQSQIRELNKDENHCIKEKKAMNEAPDTEKSKAISEYNICIEKLKTVIANVTADDEKFCYMRRLANDAIEKNNKAKSENCIKNNTDAAQALKILVDELRTDSEFSQWVLEEGKEIKIEKQSKLNYENYVRAIKPDIRIPPFLNNRYSVADPLKYLSGISKAVRAGKPVSVSVCASQMLQKLNLSSEANTCGNHTMVVVGTYWDNQGRCKVKLRNSWGKNWNQDGHARLQANDFLSVATKDTIVRTTGANGERSERNVYTINYLTPSNSGKCEEVNTIE